MNDDFNKKQFYTNSSSINIATSAGGITIGRAITERPELYSAAIIEAGILNLLRFEISHAGKSNVKELGTVSDSTELKFMEKADAMRHINPNVKYPAMYVTVGMNDPRVAPSHGAKFVAKMKDHNISGKPILLDVDYDAGHFGGASKDAFYYRKSQALSFALWQTGHPDFQPSIN